MLIIAGLIVWECRFTPSHWPSDECRGAIFLKGAVMSLLIPGRGHVVPAAIAAIALSCGCGSPAGAADIEAASARPGPFALGIVGGTLGVGAEASFRLNDWMVLRADGSGFSLSVTKTLSGNPYVIDAKALSAGLTADWHPFANGFRLSGGGRYLDMRLSGSASGGNFTINNTEYSVAALGALHAAVEGGNKIGPYAGIGFDSTHFSSGPLSLSLDVGAIYTGQPKVALSTDKSVPGLDTNLRAEEKKIEDTIKYFSFYPVIMLAGKFRF
jgi:hypothetical protein